jgi:L-serine 3-dehydrogenase (NAD+)
MRRVHKAYREKGVAVLDAPVSQGSARAKYEGTLTIMVGGDMDSPK